jgi:uncharacterized protein (TIGR02266 family)
VIPLPSHRPAPPPLPVAPEPVEQVVAAEPEPGERVTAPAPEPGERVTAPAPIEEALADPAPIEEAPPEAPSIRVEARWDVELEVDVFSDSNFYLGFTENLSGGGVFVATYMVRPIGTVLDLRIRLAGDDQPLHVRGAVRWIRTAGGDSWPGMGICFEGLSSVDDARVRDFLKTREPIFFDA